MNYVVIGIAGAIGAVLRYFVSILIPVMWLNGFPMSTLAVNYMGCLGLSWFSVRFFDDPTIAKWMKLGITTGLIGSFTTFSTFSLELVTMIHEERYIMALIYFLTSSVGGVLFAYLGVVLGRRHIHL